MKELVGIWPVIVQLSVIVTGLSAGGIITVGSITWLKEKIRLPNGKPITGGWTLALLGLWALVVTLATAVVSEQLSPGTVTPNTWGTMMLAIIMKASLRYHQMKEDMNKS